MAEVPEKQAGCRDDKGRFVPGVSGNPHGRQPGSVSLRRLIRKRLEEAPKGSKRSLAEELADRIVADAIESDGQSRKLVLEHLEGKPPAALQLTGPEGGPVAVEVVDARARLAALLDTPSED